MISPPLGFLATGGLSPASTRKTSAAVFWPIYEIQHNAAEEQTRIAESRRLPAESTSALTKYPQRSVLLTIEAVKAEQPLHGVRLAAGEQSLREALAFIGGRLFARADGPIMAVAISPDDRWEKFFR
jgi:hypothetical protein